MRTKAPLSRKGCDMLADVVHESLEITEYRCDRLARSGKGAFRAVCTRPYSTTADENLKFVRTMTFRRETTTMTTIIMPQRYYQVTHNCSNYATRPTNAAD